MPLQQKIPYYVVINNMSSINRIHTISDGINGSVFKSYSTRAMGSRLHFYHTTEDVCHKCSVGYISACIPPPRSPGSLTSVYPHCRAQFITLPLLISTRLMRWPRAARKKNIRRYIWSLAEKHFIKNMHMYIQIHNQNSSNKILETQHFGF